MKMYVGITDYDWFNILRRANCEEVNFGNLVVVQILRL